MPSFVLSNKSGGDIILSGAGGFYSGAAHFPRTGIQLKMDKSNSGNVYIALSGGLTIQSGGTGVPGQLAGMLDGVQLNPGDGYFIPTGALPFSGVFNIYALCDNAASGGFARVYWDAF